MFSVYPQVVHTQVFDHFKNFKIARDFVQMNCRVFLCEDTN